MLSMVAARVPRLKPCTTGSTAAFEFASARSSALLRSAFSERPENTHETISAVTAAISANASGSQKRMPIRTGWARSLRNLFEAIAAKYGPGTRVAAKRGKYAQQILSQLLVLAESRR